MTWRGSAPPNLPGDYGAAPRYPRVCGGLAPAPPAGVRRGWERGTSSRRPCRRSWRGQSPPDLLLSKGEWLREYRRSYRGPSIALNASDYAPFPVGALFHARPRTCCASPPLGQGLPCPRRFSHCPARLRQAVALQGATCTADPAKRGPGWNPAPTGLRRLKTNLVVPNPGGSGAKPRKTHGIPAPGVAGQSPVKPVVSQPRG